jgi:hypothetical protein
MRLRLAACPFAVLLVFAAAEAPASAGERRRRVMGDEEIRPLAITGNPLSLLIGRFGGNVEIVAAAHHAIVGSAYAQVFPVGIVRGMMPPEVRDRVRDPPVTVGGELGYRLYSGSRGTEGLFVGPSLVVTPLAYPRLTPDMNVDLVTFHAPGVALDAGVQHVTGIGLTLGGGIGVEYLAYTLPNDPRRLPVPVDAHWLPRVLMAAGWSF